MKLKANSTPKDDLGCLRVQSSPNRSRRQGRVWVWVWSGLARVHTLFQLSAWPPLSHLHGNGTHNQVAVED